MRPVKTMQSYRLPDTLIERLDRAAERMKLAKVDIVQEAIELYLDKVERQFKQSDQP